MISKVAYDAFLVCLRKEKKEKKSLKEKKKEKKKKRKERCLLSFGSYDNFMLNWITTIHILSLYIDPSMSKKILPNCWLNVCNNALRYFFN